MTMGKKCKIVTWKESILIFKYPSLLNFLPSVQHCFKYPKLRTYQQKSSPVFPQETIRPNYTFFFNQSSQKSQSFLCKNITRARQMEMLNDMPTFQNTFKTLNNSWNYSKLLLPITFRLILQVYSQMRFSQTSENKQAYWSLLVSTQ